MRALSLWEPWASLMRAGAKKIETRSWGTSYRGPLLICAAKMRDADALDLLHDSDFQRGLLPLRQPTGNVLSVLSFGCAVALVNLCACVRTDRRPADLEHRFTADEFIFGDLSPGRYAWVTENLRALKPFPVRGQQGLWELPLEIVRLVEAAL